MGRSRVAGEAARDHRHPGEVDRQVLLGGDVDGVDDDLLPKEGVAEVFLFCPGAFIDAIREDEDAPVLEVSVSVTVEGENVVECLVDGVPESRGATGPEGECDCLELGRERGEGGDALNVVGECEHCEQGGNPESVEAIDKRNEVLLSNFDPGDVAALAARRPTVELRPHRAR
jgi:hypothetical protein